MTVKRMEQKMFMKNSITPFTAYVRSSRGGLMLLVAGAIMCGSGCGSITVHHVPKVGLVSSGKESDLRHTQPLDVKAGDSSSTETSFGTVGMGKVVGKPSEWTDAAVSAVRASLSARGATIAAGSAKALTITMTKAEVNAIPIVGGARSTITLTAKTSDGLNSTFQGSDSAMAPLSAVDGAAADAVKKLLADSAVNAYLRK